MADVNARRDLGTPSCSTPFHPPPLTSALRPNNNQVFTQLPQPLDHPPSMRHPSITPSFATLPPLQVNFPSPASPCPLLPRVDFQGAPHLMSVHPPSSVIPPAPLVTSPLDMMASRRSRTFPLAPRLPSRTVPAKPASLPLSAESSSALRQTSSSPLGRIIPAHSHNAYNKRDFTRSAVPGSVYNLSVTY